MADYSERGNYHATGMHVSEGREKLYGKIEVVEVKNFDGLAFHNALVKHSFGFDYWTGVSYNVVEGFGHVEVVDVEVGDDQARLLDWEATQGWQGEAYLVFKVTDPATNGIRYFKKLGTISSCFRVTWEGPFLEVKAREEVKYVYE